MTEKLNKLLAENKITKLLYDKTIDYIVNGNYSNVAHLTVKAIKENRI